MLTPQHLSETEHEVLQHPNLTIIRYQPKLDVWAVGLFYTYAKIAQRITYLQKRNAYDLIFCETGDEPLLYYFLPKWVMQKVVVRFHSTSDTEYLHVGKHKKYKLRKLFWKWLASSKIKHICATNAYHLNYAINKVLHQPKLQTQHVVTNIITTTSTEVKPPKETIEFFMLGRMDEEGYKQKGFDDLLRALPYVHDAFSTKHARLTIIGNGTMYGEFKEQLKSYPYVTLYHEMKNTQVQELLSQSDVVLLPSRYEGVSMFALEALATGNAVIYTNTGGLIDMVNGNGILIEPNQPKQLAEAMLELLHHPNLLQLKQQSKVVAQQRFSAQVQLQQFNTLMVEVLRG